MKDSVVSARVHADIKAEAEDILRKLGIPVSVVIDSMYRQIIYRRGIPFPLTLPAMPRAMEELTAEELNAKLLHSYEQSMAGKGKPFSEAFDELEKGLS